MIGQFLIFMLAFTPLINVEKPKEVTLIQAIDQDLVEVKAISTGEYSGESIKLKVNSKTGKKYTLILNPGDHFIANLENEQDIFVVEEQILAMNDDHGLFRISGFCSEYSDAAPEEGSEFIPVLTKREELKKLAQYVNGKGFDDEIKQAAIWAVSDGKSVSNIYGSNKKEISALRKFVCDLTGQENVWFDTKSEMSIGADRMIQRSPVLVTGEVTYKLKKPGVMKSAVYTENGDVKIELVKGAPIKMATELTFEFKGKVKGWEPGNYYVKVFLDDEEIHSQKFEV